MNEHDRVKKRLEKTAIDLFLTNYNKITKKNYILLRQQEIPDAIIIDDEGFKLGLEITHLFYDSTEAKMLLGRTENIEHKIEDINKLIDRLNRLLKKKRLIGPSYITEHPCILLVRNASPIFHISDFKENIDKIKIPKGVFKEIWLLTRDPIRFKWSLIKLR
ncbi:MAG: hypothetical protein FH753_02755 [Firmicutes bacterium]|nr:hypothetical protein [Bacillota bacterium]